MLEHLAGAHAELAAKLVDLEDAARVEGGIAGMYVPYWTFDCAVQSQWRAEAGHHYYEHELVTKAPVSPALREFRPTWGRSAGALLGADSVAADKFAQEIEEPAARHIGNWRRLCDASQSKPSPFSFDRAVKRPAANTAAEKEPEGECEPKHAVVHREEGDARPYAATLIPPTIFAVSNPDIFLSALDTAGAFGVMTLFGCLPPAMAWANRHGEGLEDACEARREEMCGVLDPLVPGGRVGLGLLFGAAAAVVASEAVEKVGDAVQVAGSIGAA